MKKFLETMKGHLLLVVGLALALVITVSCEPQPEQIGAQPDASQPGARKKVASYKVEVAKLLAKAVYDEDVRIFLKEEALKKFDGDYDVLFQLVGNRKIKGGKSLNDHFNSLSSSPQRFKEASDNLPLLTIGVPTFFSAEKWNTATQIPIVAVRDEDDRLMAFNQKGESVELSPKEEPNIPILVVRLNDRVTIKSPVSGSPNGRIANENFIFNNGRNSFYFIDKSVNNLKPKTGAGRFARGVLDPVIMEAYTRSIGCGNCYQRDWIYYGINPASGNNSGPLSRKFKEAITQIEFENVSGLDAMGGWDEGSFVINVNGIFGSRTQTTNEAQMKVIPVRGEDLFTYREEIRHRGIFGINTYIVRIAEGVKRYTPVDPILYEPWDMEEYGDRWKLLVEEYDQLVEYEKTIKETTKYGVNFSANVGSKEKLGASLGATGDFEKETTTKYKTTDDNDKLGMATVLYSDPVVTDSKMYYILQDHAIYTTTYRATTGAVKISFETVRIAP